MRKTLLVATAVATVALATPASARPDYPQAPADPAAPIAGAAVGTAVGVGVYNGWFGSTLAGAALPTSTAGAVAFGGVAGIGTIALIHAATTPCRGFHALFNMGGCVNGQFVGYGNVPRRY